MHNVFTAVSGKGKKTPTDLSVSVEIHDCSEPTCGGTVYVSKRPRDAVFWSHDSSWRIGGGVRSGQDKVPQEGDNVEIQEGIKLYDYCYWKDHDCFQQIKIS